VVIAYLRRETGGVVVGVAHWPFDDFMHFRPSVVGVLLGFNLPHPPQTAARGDGADTCSPASFVRPACVRRFLRRCSALMIGVMYGESDEQLPICIGLVGSIPGL